MNTTFTSSALLFNIGNCWSKLGDTPHAVLYYERALRLAPGAEDVQANLDLERSKVVDRVNELPAFTLGSIWDRLQGGTDVDQWARRSLWACALLALAAIAGLLLRQRALKRTLFALAALALVTTLVSTALAAYRVQGKAARRRSSRLTLGGDLGEPRPVPHGFHPPSRHQSGCSAAAERMAGGALGQRRGGMGTAGSDRDHLIGGRTGKAENRLLL
ncbi:MAG: tetratricopeptide repeat protein [Flavobacteriales bacterium]|nr:tetratricopeptide repeat protein [Flavobacteriales bacterium]